MASIHSTIADEHGAQQACNSTSCNPSGTIIAGFFTINYELKTMNYEL